MATEFVLTNLPSGVISRVSQFLDPSDALSLAHTSSYLYSVVTQDGPLWRRHCERVWRCSRDADGARGWYECWLYFCREFGRYRSCYAQIKAAWEKIEFVFREKCQQAFGEVMTPAATSEKELDELETKLGVQLPRDYRCSLRLYGKLTTPLGILHHPEYRDQMSTRRFRLLGTQDVRMERIRRGLTSEYVGFLEVAENRSSIPQFASIETPVEFLFMAINDSGAEYVGCPQGHVTMVAFNPLLCDPFKFSPSGGYGLDAWSDSEDSSGGYCLGGWRDFELFRDPSATTFADWLSGEAERMQHYHISSQQGQLTRFTLKPNCEAVTGHFTVRIATATLLNRLDDKTQVANVVLCLIVELPQDACPEEYQLMEQCLFLDGGQRRQAYISFVLTQPQTTLHPGHVLEYISTPLNVENIGTLLSGHIVMQSVQGRGNTRVNLPTFILDTVKLTSFC